MTGRVAGNKLPAGHAQSSSFVAPWWCRGPHLQTLWPYLLRAAPRVDLRRERLELPDGDFLDLDWTTGAHGPIVLVVHGLEGSSDSKYARGILRAIHTRGWRGVLMHLRGCSGEINRLPRRYHSGETGDLAHVIGVLRARFPANPLAAVGYSLGGNMLLKYLGEQRQPAPLVAAVGVSVPFLLDDSANRMNRGFSRLYQRALVRRLQRATLAKQQRMRLPITTDDVMCLGSFWEFDEHVTAPLHGFHGARHYYTESSSRRFLSAITVPTLLIHAADDPFMTPAVIPSTSELSPATQLELSPEGGHVGFVTGPWPWRARYWLEERIPGYLAGYLDTDSNARTSPR